MVHQAALIHAFLVLPRVASAWLQLRGIPDSFDVADGAADDSSVCGGGVRKAEAKAAASVGWTAPTVGTTSRDAVHRPDDHPLRAARARRPGSTAQGLACDRCANCSADLEACSVSATLRLLGACGC